MKPWREGVRGLILDPAGRTLLVRFTFGVWATPGGGLDPGESYAEALRRELAEEVGLDDPELGPCIWIREHPFDDMPGFCGQRERIYLVRTPAFAPAPRLDLAAENVTDVRWWTLDELDLLEERTSPRRLRLLLRELLERGPPPAPVDVGV
jgi:8-oxo-dGTP diphosphatase